MKYLSGQNMPDHVVYALRVAGKVGFISHTLWRDCFAVNGKSRWKRRQLRNLVNENLLREHTKSIGNGYFVLTAKSRALLENENRDVVHPSPVAQLLHDETVAHSLIKLEKSGLLAGWKTENELKVSQGKEYQLSNDARNKKYPDAVLKVVVQGQEATIAIEYERTRKSGPRYKNIMWLYSKSIDFGMIIFVCENKIIETVIKGKMRYMGQTKLYRRVAFIQMDKWLEDPATAPIELGNKTVTLKEICKGSVAA